MGRLLRFKLFVYRCASSYYGNPMVVGSTCKPCDCNEAPCDNLTGQCINCLGNTVGWNCKECKPGHFGNPIVSDCRRKYNTISVKVKSVILVLVRSNIKIGPIVH